MRGLSARREMHRPDGGGFSGYAEKVPADHAPNHEKRDVGAAAGGLCAESVGTAFVMRRIAKERCACHGVGEY